MDGPIETVVHECRMHFLRAAAQHPNIGLAASLNDRVFKPSRSLWSRLGLPVPQEPVSDYTQEQCIEMERFQHEQSGLIEAWATDHHLNFEWVRSAARDALLYGSFQKHPFSTISGYPPPRLVWLPWFFEFESEPIYRERMSANFQQVLDSYVGDIKRLRKKFLPDRGSRKSHYRWAAEHVCLGWKWGYIARQNGAPVSWQAVRKAVLPILAAIGVPESTT